MGEVLERAIEYFAQGYNLVLCPIGNETKVKWGQFQHKRQVFYDVITMARQFPTYENVCIITGFNSETVFDFDAMTDYEQFKSLYPHYCQTYSVKTGRGMHLHYKLTANLPFEHSLCEFWQLGHFANLPGNIHKSGKRYEQVGSYERMELTVSDLLTMGFTLKTNPPRKKVSDLVLPETKLSFLRGGGICDKIKAQVKIPDILDCDFEMSGAYHAMAHCPFHPDNEKSLSYHLESNKVKCFSSKCVLSDSWHSVIDVYMLIHNVDYKTAISQLSRYVRD